MKILVQRVSEARVSVQNQVVGEIKNGLLLLVGVETIDTVEKAQTAARKVSRLRVFEDDSGKTNLDVKAVGGQLLVISQFTLCASTHDGNRPSFVYAAKPELGLQVYEAFVEALENEKIPVQTGRFGKTMEVSLTNRGPFTIPMEF